MKIDSLKSYIFVATTAIGVTLYAHAKFATNMRVDEIQDEQDKQGKIGCLIARKIKVEESKLEKICNYDL